jgi:hypothetical protein
VTIIGCVGVFQCIYYSSVNEMKKTKFLQYIVAIAAAAGATSAMAYPKADFSKSYGPGAAVEYEGRVYQQCWDCRGMLGGMSPGTRWSWGNPWEDRGPVATAVLAPKPSSASTPASTGTWKAGTSYAKGAVVTYNGAKYVASTDIKGMFVQMTPDKSSRWQRM